MSRSENKRRSGELAAIRAQILRRAAATEFFRHGRRLKAIVSFRPDTTVGDGFGGRSYVPLGAYKLFATRFQFKAEGSSLVPQTPLGIFAPRFDPVLGGAWWEAVTAFDLCQHEDGGPCRRLDAAQNASAANLAIAMLWALDDNSGVHLPAPVPTPVYYGFRLPAMDGTTPDDGKSFRFEYGNRVGRLAAAAGLSVDDFWVSRGIEHEHDGETYMLWDADLLAHGDEDYLTHPVDGSPAPELRGTEEGARAGGWVWLYDRWWPLAQAPDVMFQGLPPLGLELRNPSWYVLQAEQFVSWKARPLDVPMTFEQASLQDRLDYKIKDEPAWAHRVRARIGMVCQALGLPCTGDNITALLADPNKPLVMPDRAAIQIVKLGGVPSPRTLRWDVPGQTLDLFDMGAPGFDPVTPEEFNRLAALRRNVQ